MRRRVLCGCWARLAFLRAREKKALVVVVAKIERPVKSNSCLPQGNASVDVDVGRMMMMWQRWDVQRSILLRPSAACDYGGR